MGLSSYMQTNIIMKQLSQRDEVRFQVLGVIKRN